MKTSSALKIHISKILVQKSPLKMLIMATRYTEMCAVLILYASKGQQYIHSLEV